MTAPRKPTLLWDGDCGFCRRWIERGQRATGDAIDYRPFQEALADFPQVTAADCAQAVQLVLPDGQVLQAAHAVLQALACGNRARWLLTLYQRSGLFRRAAEAAYRCVARNRSRL